MRYVRENWGIPFIVAFILLLLVAAILFKSFDSIAEGAATCAYFTLAIGIGLELGKVNSNSVRKDIAQFKEFRIISKCIRFRKNQFNKRAVFHGSD